MRKNIGIVMTFIAVFGFVPILSASVFVLYDFESPTYSLGNLNGQGGWSGTGSVVAKPSFMPESAGTQTSALQTGSTAAKSLAGSGFTETTQFSALFGFDYTQIPDVYWYSELHLNANDGSGVKPFAIFGAEWFGGNMLYAHNGAAPVEVANSAWNDVSTFRADVTLDFAQQRYRTVWRDAATSAELYDFGWFAFKNLISLSQMEASGTMTFDIGSAGGNWTAYMDNISLDNKKVNYYDPPYKKLCDFESPKYSLGNLNGQDGWSGTGSVVSKPSFMTESAGAQTAALDTGATAARSLAGSGFTETSQFSALMSFDYTQIPSTYWYSEMHLNANDGVSVKPIAIFGAEWFGGSNMLYAHNGATPVEVANSSWNSVSNFRADVTLDFAAQQYRTVWVDAETSAILYDFGWFDFKNAITLEQMEASGTLTFDIGSAGGNWTAYVDNISLNYATMPGDANGDGKVDEDDAARLAANWLGLGGWAHGDFNGDGIVNDADATLMAANWHYGVSQASVPEPCTFGLLLAALASLMCVRMTRRVLR